MISIMLIVGTIVTFIFEKLQIYERSVGGMLNHKFYFCGAGKENKNDYIRISNELMKKMRVDLRKYKFTWCEYDEPRYGLSNQVNMLSSEELMQIRECLLKQSEDEWEYDKFMGFLERAIFEAKEVRYEYVTTWGLMHKFYICDVFPTESIMDYNYYKYNYDYISIHDQFIMENYNVFKNVKLYWNNTETVGNGFAYYGETLISTQMAQELLDVMAEYLKDNMSEEAMYFRGREYDVLVEILEEALAKNKVVIHFGI